MFEGVEGGAILTNSRRIRYNKRAMKVNYDEKMQKIIESKPKAVIAVPCERDLTSGVQDAKQVPVLGVFNKRPNGPCVDTKIEIKEVENAIKFFIGEC